jgi:hypothetical protein
MLPSMNPVQLASTLATAPAHRARKGVLQQLKGRLELTAARPPARSDFRTRLTWAFSQMKDPRERLMLFSLLYDAANAFQPQRGALPPIMDERTLEQQDLPDWARGGSPDTRRKIDEMTEGCHLVVQVNETLHASADGYKHTVPLTWSWLRIPVCWTPSPDLLPLPGVSTRWDPWIPWLMKEAKAMVAHHDRIMADNPDLRDLSKEELHELVSQHGVRVLKIGPVKEGTKLSQHLRNTFEGYSRNTPWVGFQASMALGIFGSFQALRHRVQQLIDWLEEERPDVMPMSLWRATELSEAWHRQFAASANYKSPVTRGLPVVTWPDGWRIERIVTSKEAEEEGTSMGHCVGGHWRYIRDGDELIFSIRDPEGRPWGTVALSLNAQHVAEDVNQLIDRDRELAYELRIAAPDPDGLWYHGDTQGAVFTGDLPIRGEWTQVKDLKGHNNGTINNETAASRMAWFLDVVLNTDIEGHTWALGNQGDVTVVIDGTVIPDWIKEKHGLQGEPSEETATQKWQHEFIGAQQSVDTEVSMYRECANDAEKWRDIPGIDDLSYFYQEHGEDSSEWAPETILEHEALVKPVEAWMDSFFTDQRGMTTEEMREEWENDDITLPEFADWYVEVRSIHDAQYYGQEAWRAVKDELVSLRIALDGVQVSEVEYDDFRSHGGNYRIGLYFEDTEYLGDADPVYTVIANGSSGWDEDPSWEVRSGGGSGDLIGTSNQSALYALLDSGVLITKRQNEERKAELAKNPQEDKRAGQLTQVPEWIWLHPDITIPMHQMQERDIIEMDGDQRRTFRRMIKDGSPNIKAKQINEAAEALSALEVEEIED